MKLTKNKKIVAIIPARGGSKGIPGKNIKEFCGQPLIAWSIKAAKDSGVLSRIIVSTDDHKIGRAAKALGAEAPFKRPARLAQDHTPTLPVIIQAVNYLKEKESYEPDYVLLLEPTSPGRQARHIKEAVEMILATGADSVVSVEEVASRYSPYWQFKAAADGRLEIVTGGPLKDIITRRQALPKTYIRNGVFYLFKTRLLLADKPSLYGQDCRAYVMDQAYNLDIDTPEDWAQAEAKMKLLINKHS